MKESHLYTAFILIASAAFLFLWWHASNSSIQIGGALQGIPGTDPISPFMAVIMVIWFMLVGFVIHLNHRR